MLYGFRRFLERGNYPDVWTNCYCPCRSLVPGMDYLLSSH
ncbi:hypothetical protein NC652_028309 [Populus alba x Populus x berolinensis]|nr:hypothetical protein NC652_028309 [Populus alba x Populus x berolinensis]